jgi:hypothetical protein
MSYPGPMRLWLLVLTLGLPLGGCITPDPGPGSSGGWGSGYGGGGGGGGFGCHQDSDCGGGSTVVCARDGECLASSQVKTVHVTWTLKGAAAGAITCAASSDLDLTFAAGAGDQFGFSPVPCAEGKFTVDKLPTWYTEVELSRTGDQRGGASGLFDATGTAALDLPY